jgi:hypothetical protein
MRALARWSAAAAGSLAVFAGCWAVCRYGAGLDTGTSLGVAAAPLAVALAVLGWWAAREPVRLAGAEGSITAEATGQRSEAVAGNLGVNIGGEADLRGAVINFAVAGRPLGAAPPHVGQAPAGPVVVGDIPRPPPAFQSRDCTLITRRDLAVAYQQQGRVREAIPMFERTLADYERVYGTDHAESRAVREALAALRRSGGDGEAGRAVT